MRTVGWLIAMFVNCAVVALFAPSAFDNEAPAMDRLINAGLTALFMAVTALLALARFARLPTWGSQAMLCLCTSLPLLWLLGSFDYGILSGQEFLSVLVISLFAWGTWRAFKLFPPQA